MKAAIYILIIAFAFGCSHPIHTSTKADPSAITSGTLGSARVENGIRTPVDTTRRKTDTPKIRRDSL